MRGKTKPVHLVHQSAELIVELELLQMFLFGHSDRNNLVPNVSSLYIFRIFAAGQHVLQRADILILNVAESLDSGYGFQHRKQVVLAAGVHQVGWKGFGAASLLEAAETPG